MLRKSELERKIKKLQKDANELGLFISELIVKEKKVITELEKNDIGKFLKLKRRPHFISVKNYPKVAKWFKWNEYGRLFDIKLIKKEGD